MTEAGIVASGHVYVWNQGHGSHQLIGSYSTRGTPWLFGE